MDKKHEIRDYDDMSYDEVHALLVEVMQEACTSVEAGPYESPSIDLSFLDEEPEFQPEKKKRRLFNMSRFNKVAAIIIIALLGINIVMMATDSYDSYSEGGLLHRIYEGARGIFTDEDESEYVEMSETGDVWTINNENDLDSAKNIWKDICIPQYIPEGYKFKSLEIIKEINGDYYANYKYEKDGNILKIGIMYLDKNGNNISNNKEDIIILKDRIINIYWDNVHGFYIADVYFEDIIISIYGKIEKDELQKVAEFLLK